VNRNEKKIAREFSVVGKIEKDKNPESKIQEGQDAGEDADENLAR